MRSLSAAAAALLALAVVAPLAAAHGYLSSPPPRGIQKASYQIDDLKSPNRRGLCRGEPVGTITPVQPGQSLTLGLTITAPHRGPCRVTLLDANLANERPVAEKMDCAAPGGPGSWTIQLPAGVSGHQVLRWYWEGHHVSPPELYEQCIDLDFGGGAGDANPVVRTQAAPTTKPPTPEPQPKATPASEPQPTYTPEPVPEESYTPEPETPAPRPAARSRKHKGYTGNDQACAANAYRCAGDASFDQCANGQWTRMACPLGTVCQPNGDAIVCGRASYAA